MQIWRAWMLNSFRKHRNRYFLRRKYLCLTRHSESSNKILMWVSFLWTEQSREKINHCMLPGLLDPWPRIRGSEYNDEDGHQRKNHQDANLIMAPRIFTFARISISSFANILVSLLPWPLIKQTNKQQRPSKFWQLDVLKWVKTDNTEDVWQRMSSASPQQCSQCSS